MDPAIAGCQNELAIYLVHHNASPYFRASELHPTYRAFLILYQISFNERNTNLLL